MATESTKQIGFHRNKAEVSDSASLLVASRHRQHQYMTGPEWGVGGGGAEHRGLLCRGSARLYCLHCFCETPLTCALRTGQRLKTKADLSLFMKRNVVSMDWSTSLCVPRLHKQDKVLIYAGVTRY